MFSPKREAIGGLNRPHQAREFRATCSCRIREGPTTAKRDYGFTRHQRAPPGVMCVATSPSYSTDRPGIWLAGSRAPRWSASGSRRRRSELTAVRDKQIGNVMGLTVLVADTVLCVHALAASAQVVCARERRQLEHLRGAIIRRTSALESTLSMILK